MQQLDEVSFRTLSSRIGNEWEMLATHLGFRLDQIERLKQDNPNIEDTMFDMLVTWRRKQPGDEAVQVLVEALRNSGRNDLAQQLQGEGGCNGSEVHVEHSMTSHTRNSGRPILYSAFIHVISLLQAWTNDSPDKQCQHISFAL